MEDLVSISQYQDLVGGLTYEQCKEEDVFYRNFKITMAALGNEKAKMEDSKSSNLSNK